MTKPPTTPQPFLLFDANVVFEAYRREVWDLLLQKAPIAVPSIVARDEAIFVQRGVVPVPLRLAELIGAGELTELTAEAREMQAVTRLFDHAFITGLHPGELEALAIVQSKGEAVRFCSGDQMAIQALTMMGCPELGVSLENVLRRVGLQRPLLPQFTDGFFKKHITIGSEKRIRGEGLRR